MNDNALTARFVSRATLAVLHDSDLDGRRVRVERFGSIYPGGASVCSLTIERDPLRPLPFAGADIVQLFNGPRMVWEGNITSIGAYVGDASQGVRVNSIGHWGWLMGRTIDKRWADNRLTEDAWADSLPTGYSDTNRDKFTVDRTARLRIETKAATMAVSDGHSLTYSQPTGQTTKRVKLSYNFQEGAQNYGWRLFNVTAANNIWNLTASGAGTRDDTPATPSQHIFLTLYSGAVQAAVADGTLFGQIDDAVSGATALMVYSETGNINCLEIFKDVRAMVPELSSDETAIDTSLTVSIEPFITIGQEAYSSILARIAGYGTSSYGAIGYGIKDSSQSSDGKPILFAEPWPVLTDYEYEISLSAPNLTGGLNVVRDYGAIANWLVVTYQDLQGVSRVLTPDDDANLKDDDSISRFGKRQLSQPLSLGQLSQTAAVQYCRRYLAAAKDPQVYVSGAIRLAGYVNGKSGSRVPTSHVQAGQRAKIVDFVSDVIDVAGAGLTAVITFAEYTDDNGGTVSLSFGVPDNLAIMLARARLVTAQLLRAGEAQTWADQK